MTWAGLAGGMVVIALAMEVSSIRARQGGANGLAWLAAMIVSAIGSLGVAVISWIFAGGTAALAVASLAAAGLLVSWYGGGALLQWQVRKVKAGEPGSVR